MRVLVTGLSGFVGGHLSQRLLADGHQVVGLSRSPQLNSESGAISLQGDVTTGVGLTAAVNGVDAVIHLVGIIRERPDKSGDQTFERVHVDGTSNLLNAMRDAGVERLIHMSASGADPASDSAYLSTKGRAEALVRASGVDWTILRPDTILGVGDDFFCGVLRDLVTKPPIIPVVGKGAFPFRPITVHDVATAFSRALERPTTVGHTFDLAGPREYTLRELQVLVRDAMGVNKPLISVPLPLMRLGITLFKLLPNPPITHDQFVMLINNDPGEPAPAVEALGLELQEIEDHLADILAATPVKAAG